MNKKLTTVKKLWIAIGVLALLSPLGLILPALFGAGGAWGEWGLEEIEKIAGLMPAGMKRLAHFWKAPLADYAVPGQGEGAARTGLGYVLTGVIGVAATAAAAYLIVKLLARKERNSGKE